MVNPVFKLIFKCSVLLVHIQIIAFIRIIGNINIRITIPVDIANRYPQTKTDQAAVYAGFFGYFCKMPVIVSV